MAEIYLREAEAWQNMQTIRPSINHSRFYLPGSTPEDPLGVSLILKMQEVRAQAARKAA
jgi:hypothetical protein